MAIENIDAFTRLYNGDWKGENTDTLRAKGLIHRDPERPTLWRDEAGNAYTISALANALLQVKYGRRDEAHRLASSKRTRRAAEQP